MTWRIELCDWDGPDGKRCTLYAGHTPLKAWPHHAPDPLFHLGCLIGHVRYPGGVTVAEQKEAL